MDRARLSIRTNVSPTLVKTLRDKNIVLPVHVHTDNNLADIFTKILDEDKFTQLRSKLMRERPTIKME